MSGRVTAMRTRERVLLGMSRRALDGARPVVAGGTMRAHWCGRGPPRRLAAFGVSGALFRVGRFPGLARPDPAGGAGFPRRSRSAPTCRTRRAGTPAVSPPASTASPAGAQRIVEGSGEVRSRRAAATTTPARSRTAGAPRAALLELCASHLAAACRGLKVAGVTPARPSRIIIGRGCPAMRRQPCRKGWPSARPAIPSHARADSRR